MGSDNTRAHLRMGGKSQPPGPVRRQPSHRLPGRNRLPPELLREQVRQTFVQACEKVRRGIPPSWSPKTFKSGAAAVPPQPSRQLKGQPIHHLQNQAALPVRFQGLFQQLEGFRKQPLRGDSPAIPLQQGGTDLSGLGFNSFDLLDRTVVFPELNVGVGLAAVRL